MRYAWSDGDKRLVLQVKRSHVDMRLPVNPRSLTVLSSRSSVQAGGHHVYVRIRAAIS